MRQRERLKFQKSKKSRKRIEKLVEDCERVGEWGVIWGVGGMVCEKKFPAHILQLS